MNQLLEVSTVAKLLKCNKNKVYELVKSGQLQALKLGRMKITTMELDSFLQRNLGKDLSDPYHIKDLNEFFDESKGVLKGGETSGI